MNIENLAIEQRTWITIRLTTVAMLLMLMSAPPVNAADYPISAGTSSVDCDSHGGGVSPGDSITLASGKRGDITFRNCRGTASSPIVIRNDVNGTGPTIIEKTSESSGGFVFRCNNCEHVTIDGTGKWTGAPAGRCGVRDGVEGRTQCGIIVRRISNAKPSVYVMHDGDSTRFTVRGVEIDGRAASGGGGGIGFHLRDQNTLKSQNSGKWRENVLYEYNYVHDTGASAFYIGANWSQGEIPLRNIEVRNSLVEDVGRRGISIKSSIEGTNVIRNNHIYRTGIEAVQGGFGHGIMFFEGGGIASHNYIEGAGESGIECFNLHVPSSVGPFPCEVFNNVVVSPGMTGPLKGNGINVGRQASDDGEFDANIYNNTIVNTESSGVSINSEISIRGRVQSNIIADAGGAAISVRSTTVNSENWVGQSASVGFVNRNANDFHLTENSPARDAGNSDTFPSDDFDGVPRPPSGPPDQGAFEYTTDRQQPIIRPNPPSFTLAN